MDILLSDEFIAQIEAISKLKLPMSLNHLKALLALW